MELALCNWGPLKRIMSIYAVFYVPCCNDFYHVCVVLVYSLVSLTMGCNLAILGWYNALRHSGGCGGDVKENIKLEIMARR